MRALTAIIAIALTAPASAGVVNALKLALNNQPPRQGFEAQTPPPAPDYAQAANWAARPGRGGEADIAPRGVANPPERNRRADVFFVPPTTFYGEKRWNAAVPDKKVDELTDKGPMRGQASAFNLCCRIWAPRYRQMVLGGFTRWSGDSDRAMDLAYGDVSRAFDQFLKESGGRPFIIAGHSQGSRLARRLVAERIDGTPLARRMVAAYLVGTWIPQSWFAGLKDVAPCTGPAQIGCVATWSSYAEGRDASQARARFARTSRYLPEQADEPFVCTNPVSWTADSETVPASASKGAWLFGPGPLPRRVDPGVSARCNDGAVYVSTPPGDIYAKQKLPFIDWHNVDYNLFYMDVRDNAKVRADAWFARKG